MISWKLVRTSFRRCPETLRGLLVLALMAAPRVADASAGGDLLAWADGVGPGRFSLDSRLRFERFDLAHE